MSVSTCSPFFEKSSDNSFETHEFINLGVRDVLEVSAIVRANSERHAFKSPDIQVVSDALRAIGTSSFARAAKSSPVSWKISSMIPLSHTMCKLSDLGKYEIKLAYRTGNVTNYATVQPLQNGLF